MYFFSCFFVFVFYICIKQLKQTIMNTIKTLNLALLTLGAFVFTYLTGHVIMSILFYLEITDFVISKDMDTILHFGFGLPVLWLQIKVMKFAKQLTNNLN